MYKNYRKAQSTSRDKMIVQVDNLIKSKHYIEARKIAGEIIDICEERAKNIQVRGVKLALKNAYELMLKIPELSLDEQANIKGKLYDLMTDMTHDDLFCKDGDQEFPLRPY